VTDVSALYVGQVSSLNAAWDVNYRNQMAGERQRRGWCTLYIPYYLPSLYWLLAETHKVLHYQITAPWLYQDHIFTPLHHDSSNICLISMVIGLSGDSSSIFWSRIASTYARCGLLLQTLRGLCYVFVCWCDDREPCKNGWTDRDTVLGRLVWRVAT